MCLCTNNLSPLTALHSIIFYGAYRFGKSMILFLLIDLYNIFNDTKNIIFNLTIVLTQK